MRIPFFNQRPHFRRRRFSAWRSVSTQWRKNPAYTFGVFFLLLLLAPSLYVLLTRIGKTQAAVMEFSESSTEVQIDVANRYRAIMQKSATTNYILFYDRAEDNSTPDATHEIKSPCVTATNTYCLHNDPDRKTTILEVNDTKIKVRVEGKFIDGSSNVLTATTGSAYVIRTTVDYTFTIDGMSVDTVTDFRGGFTMGADSGHNGYEWLGVMADVTDGAFDDSANIIYGDGNTEGTTNTDGGEFSKTAGRYVVLPGTGSGTYQDAFIGIPKDGWYTDTVNASPVQEWHWDINFDGTKDQLTTQDQNAFMRIHTSRWYFHLLAESSVNTEAEREGYLNNLWNPDELTINTGAQAGYGNGNGALLFDGNSDRADVPHSAVLNRTQSDVTLSAWVYMTQTPSAQAYIVGKRYGVNYAYGLLLNTNDRIVVQIRNSGGTDSYVEASGTMDYGVWTHLAVTIDDNGSNTTVKLYKNGVLQWEKLNNARRIGDNGEIFTMGKYPHLSSGGYFAGALDDIRVYDIARTQAQIQSDMMREVPGNSPNLIAYWKFNEPSGQVFFDETSNNNDGTLGATSSVSTDDPLRYRGGVPTLFNPSELSYGVEASSNTVNLDIDAGANASTTVGSAITAGATSITVASTTGFASSGIAYIEGDKFSYTGTTSSTFTGIPSTGELAVLGHASGEVVSTSNRINPLFNIQKYRQFSDSFDIDLDGSFITSGTEYNMSQKPLSAGLMANAVSYHASFESTTVDIGSNLTNGGCTTVAGYINRGIQCDGNTEYYSFSATNNFNPEEGVMEMWVQPLSDHDDSSIHIFAHQITSGKQFRFRKSGATNELEFLILDGTTSFYEYVSPSDYGWTAGEWVHLRVEWDDSASQVDQMKIFVNGEQPPSTNNNTTDYDGSLASELASGTFYLGNNASLLTSQFCNCIIDEFVIYDTTDVNEGRTTLAVGGNASNANEYLNDTTNNATFYLSPVDANGRGEYVYFGSDQIISGLNVDLATPGVSGGSLNLDWEYWNGITWTSAESVTGFTDGTSNFTQDGAVYWDEPLPGWAVNTIYGSTPLYYIRASLNASSGTYSTFPIENQIVTDTLSLQYLGTLSSEDHTFDISQAVTATPTPASQEPNQPVLHWKFDEGYGSTANDSTTNDNDGTKTNGIWRDREYCLSGSCIYFDGSGDYVSRADDPDLDFDGDDSFTLSAWIKTPPVSSAQTIIAKYETSGSDGGYKMYMDSDGDLYCGIDANNSGFPADVANSTDANYDDSIWHHVVCTRDTGSKELRLYVDGELVNTKTNAVSNTLSNDDTFYVGIDGDGSSNPWRGFIDEVKVYDQAIQRTHVFSEHITRGSTTNISAQMGGDNLNSLTDGLIGYWPMDDRDIDSHSCLLGGTGDVCDYSGRNNNGTDVGSMTDSDYIGGKFGMSLDFDGSDDRITIPNESQWDLSQEVTLAAWIRIDSFTDNWETIISKGNDGYRLSRYGSTNQLEFSVNDVSTNYTAFTTTSVNDGEWHHVVGTFDGNASRIYLDGVLEGEATAPPNTTMVQNDYSVFLGHNGQITNRTWGGDIDEARIYSRGLSSKEVQALYNWAAGPIVHISMDEGSGTSTAFDRSSFGNNATLSNMTEAAWVPGKYGKGIQFNGSDRSGSITHTSQLNVGSPTDSYTVQAWVYYETQLPGGYGARIVNKGQDGWGNGIQPFDMGIFSNFSGTDFVYFTVHDGTTSTTAGGFGVPEAALSPGNWYHVTSIRDAGTDTLRIYVNGLLVHETTDTTNGALQRASNIAIGRRGESQSGFFYDVIDDVRIYDYARTTGQIVQDMNGGHPLGGSPVGSQVAHWKMDNIGETTLSNAVDNTFTTSISGASWRTSADCKYNSCLEFDGSDDVATITNANNIDMDIGLSNGFSFSTWFYAHSDGENDTGQIFQKGTNTWCRTDSQSGSSLDIECSLDLATTDASVNIASAVETNTWNHLVMTYDDASQIRVYINGHLRGSNTGSGATASDTSNLLIGGSSSANFDGLIDDFKIYSATLTGAEVLIDMNANASINVSTGVEEKATISGGAGNPPVAYWSFDDNTGTSAVDRSGNGQTGTLGNSPEWSAGKRGAGLNFAGSGSQNVQATATFGNPTTMTYSAWIYPRSGGEGGLGRIIHKRTGNGAPSFLTSHGFLGSSRALRFEYDFSVVTGQWNSPNDILTYDEWNHVAVTYDNSSTSNAPVFYVNGVQQTTTTVQSPSGSPSTGTNIYIGNRSDLGRTFDGILDEVRIYDYVQSHTQILYDYNRGAPIAHYKIDECTGSTIYNSAPAANGAAAGSNGTLTVGASGTQTSAGDCTTNASTAWYNGRNGKFNGSLNFDGTDDEVSVGFVSNAPQPNQPQSYAFWYKATSNPSTTQAIFAHRNGSGEGNVVGFRSSQLMVWKSSGTQILAATPPTAGEWHHVTYVTDGTNHTLYINGQVAHTSTVALDSGTAPELYLGSNGSFNEQFAGQIDDARMYTYPLSASQVLIVMNEGSSARFGP